MYASEADNKDAKLFNCVQVLDELLFPFYWLNTFVLFSWVFFSFNGFINV